MQTNDRVVLVVFYNVLYDNQKDIRRKQNVLGEEAEVSFKRDRKEQLD
jgi:hypothetical protein